MITVITTITIFFDLIDIITFKVIFRVFQVWIGF